MDAFLSNMDLVHCTQHQVDVATPRDDLNMFLTPDDTAPNLPLDRPPTPIRPHKKRRLSTIDEDSISVPVLMEKRDPLPGGVLSGYFDGTDFSEANWLREKEKVGPTRSIGPDCYVGEMVGRGDFAGVLLAGSYLTTRVAKKAMKRSRKFMSPRMKGHFMREAQALAKALGHPNIVGFQGGTIRSDDSLLEEHTIMSEFCDSDLQKMIKKNESFPEERLYGIVKDIASALSHIHSLGIVHMDVKPANVLVLISEVTNKEVFKLADFGMATRIDGKGDDEQGTGRYMDSGLGKRRWQMDKIDVYSLGVCICDLKMGCDSSQLSQDLERARGDGVPGLSRPFQDLIKGMLAIKRQDRPSALEVLRKIQSIIRNVSKQGSVDTVSEGVVSLNVMVDKSNSID